MRKQYILFAILGVIAALSGCRQKLADGNYTLHLLSTNDIHGCWFDYDYTQPLDDSAALVSKRSLLGINTFIQNFRDSVGAENVILVDAGDCLQGDNAPYYFNYIDTLTPHLFPRLVEYMGYDAVVVGNHDVETAHPVYDRVRAQLEERKVPFLAGNAIRNDNGKSYFAKYAVVRRGGLKVAILGYTNPNMRAWLSEDIWSGMHFESLIPLVQNDVDAIKKRERADVVIVAIHSGVGDGDGSILESQGLDLYKSLQGVDFLVCSHDHRAQIIEGDSIVLLNSGSHARNIAHGTLNLRVEGGKVTEKRLAVELVENNFPADAAMRSHFMEDFMKVREFTLTPVGEVDREIATRDAFTGMSDYINLVHTVGLNATKSDISLAAPLTYNKKIAKGELIYNDMFTLYPYENQLYVIRMSGEQIKNYLEQSYDLWIQSDNPEHTLKIQKRDDLRYSQRGWSFVNRSYNFDSAGGINYTVDITKPKGERVVISSLANSEEFDMQKEYNVALTSYRANGGGDLLRDGAGIDPDDIEAIIVARYKEYRDLIYDFIKENKKLTPELIGNKSVIGEWQFIPQPLASNRIANDMKLLFE